MRIFPLDLSFFDDRSANRETIFAFVAISSDVQFVELYK